MLLRRTLRNTQKQQNNMDVNRYPRIVFQRGVNTRQKDNRHETKQGEQRQGKRTTSPREKKTEH